jgi:hypothetical protein
VAAATGRFLGATPSEKRQLKERYGTPRPEPETRARLKNATNATAATR